MYNSRKIFRQLAEEMGFEIKDGKLTTTVGGGDMKNMRQDIRNIGNDMRKVLGRLCK